MYFLEADEFSSIDAGTFLGGTIPCVWAGQVGRPERPDSALVGSYVIDDAFLPAIDLLEEDTVFCVWMFDDRSSKAITSEIFFSQLRYRYIEGLCDEFDLWFCDPDVPFTRAAAALATLLTLEMQSRNIPGGIIFYHFNTAPVSALVAIEAYFASAPFVILGCGSVQLFLRSANSSSESFTFIALFGMSISMISPFFSKPMGPPTAASGLMCPMEAP